MNKVILIGRLTKDVDFMTTNNGIDVARFTLAVNRAYKTKDGDVQADFFNIVAWRNLASTCANYLNKGRQCAVTGNLQNRSYDDQDGNKRYVTEVIAENVEFLGGGEKEEQHQKPAVKKPIAELQPIDDDDELPF